MPVSHVTYTFQSESTLHSCLNVKELLAWSMHEIWSLSDCNWAQTHIYLVHKQTLNHLAKLTSLAKWLSAHLWTKGLWVRVQLQLLKLPISPALSKEFLDIQATTECGFTLKRVCDMTRTYSRSFTDVLKNRCFLKFCNILFPIVSL